MGKHTATKSLCFLIGVLYPAGCVLDKKVDYYNKDRPIDIIYPGSFRFDGEPAQPREKQEIRPNWEFHRFENEPKEEKPHWLKPGQTEAYT